MRAIVFMTAGCFTLMNCIAAGAPNPKLAEAQELDLVGNLFGGLFGLGVIICVAVLGLMWILIPVILYFQLGQLRAIRGLSERTLLLIKQNGLQPYPQPSAAPRPSPPPPPVPPSPVDITCPTCAHPFSVVPGVRSDCPRCGEHVLVDPPN